VGTFCFEVIDLHRSTLELFETMRLGHFIRIFISTSITFRRIVYTKSHQRSRMHFGFFAFFSGADIYFRSICSC